MCYFAPVSGINNRTHLLAMSCIAYFGCKKRIIAVMIKDLLSSIKKDSTNMVAKASACFPRSGHIVLKNNFEEHKGRKPIVRGIRGETSQTRKY